MPGLVGIISASISAADAALVEAMSRRMAHEPFYQSRTHVDPQVGLASAWIMRDEQEPELYPVWNAEQTTGIIVVGDILIPETAAKSKRHNKSDVARWILKRYESEGFTFLTELDGWFSGVLFDRRRRATTLFNDRYGLGRVYLHEGTDRFYFASEAKSLLAAIPEARSFDPISFGEHLSCGCTLENRTLFSGISLMPAGSVLTFDAGAPSNRRRYFDLASWTGQEALAPLDFKRRLFETFPAILDRYFQADGRIGMSLTGGLDGRMIMAWLPKDVEVACYTFGGPYRDCADVTIARKVARALGLQHQTIQVGDDFLRQFPDLAAKAVYVSDGCMDVTGSAELYVNALARSIAPVRMTGNYGSEILRSHVAFRAAPVSPRLFTEEIVRAGAVAQATYFRHRAGGNDLAFILKAQLPWHHYSRLSLEQSQLTVRSPFLDQELVSLAFQAPTVLARSVEPAMELIAHGNPAMARLPNDRGLVLSGSRLQNSARKAWSEALARLEYAFDYGMPGWFAAWDRLLKPLHLERLLLGFQKFCHFRIWYRDRLRDYVLDILRDSKTRARPYYNRAGLDALAQNHARGGCAATLDLHRVLSLELIERQLLSAVN